MVHARSAMPISMQKTTMTQEILRILLRCSKNLEWRVVAGHCSEFNKRMQYSGYNHKFRSIVTSSAINAYKKIRERDEDGSTPMYRKKEIQP